MLPNLPPSVCCPAADECWISYHPVLLLGYLMQASKPQLEGALWMVLGCGSALHGSQPTCHGHHMSAICTTIPEQQPCRTVAPTFSVCLPTLPHRPRSTRRGWACSS